MLTIRKISSARAADYSQYLTGRARDEQSAWRSQGDYYTGDGAAGVWCGDDAALGGIAAKVGERVEQEGFERALQGQRIDTGEQVRRPGANGVVNSHDLTMGVPKSVSVLWAQSSAAERELIEQAVRTATERTVRYMALTTPCVQRLRIPAMSPPVYG